LPNFINVLFCYNRAKKFLTQRFYCITGVINYLQAFLACIKKLISSQKKEKKTLFKKIPEKITDPKKEIKKFEKMQIQNQLKKCKVMLKCRISFRKRIFKKLFFQKA